VGAVTALAALIFPAAALPVGMGCVSAVLLFFAHHWKVHQVSHAGNLAAKVRAAAHELAEIRALVALQEPRFAAPLPWSSWALPPRGLLDVLSTVRREDAKTIVECGSGVSTLHLAHALRALGRGHLFSLEEDPRWADHVRGMLEVNGLADWATVVTAPLAAQTHLGHTTRWYDLTAAALPPSPGIDLLLVDGPRGIKGQLARLGAVPALWERLSGAAIIYLDDADRPEEREIFKLWCEHFPLSAEVVVTERGMERLTRVAPRPAG